MINHSEQQYSVEQVGQSYFIYKIDIRNNKSAINNIEIKNEMIKSLFLPKSL